MMIHVAVYRVRLKIGAQLDRLHGALGEETWPVILAEV